MGECTESGLNFFFFFSPNHEIYRGRGRRIRGNTGMPLRNLLKIVGVENVEEGFFGNFLSCNGYEENSRVNDCFRTVSESQHSKHTWRVGGPLNFIITHASENAGPYGLKPRLFRIQFCF